MNRASLYVIVVLSLMLVGCDRVQQFVPRSSDSSSAEGRYQFERDNQGRLLRLDTVTGEMSFVNDGVSAVVPPSQSGATSRNTRTLASGATRRQPQGTDAATPATVETLAPATTAVDPPRGEMELEEAIALRPAIGAQVRLGRAAPVFLTARDNQTPLELLNEGTIARIRGIEGNWYFIEFLSPRWGRRVGYVKSSVIEPGEQPMDLSVPHALVPLDLSGPGSTLTPLDLSVPEQK